MIETKWMVGAGLIGVTLRVVALMLRAGPEDCTMEIIKARGWCREFGGSLKLA